MSIVELRSLDDFHSARRAGRIIIITDFPNDTVTAHPADCMQHLRDAWFIQKVVENGGENGRYFSASSLDEAQSAHGAQPCALFNP